MRSTRYMFARRCAASEAKALAVVPVFNMEAVSGVRATVHVKSLPNVGNAFQFIGPNGALEYNFHVMYAPWPVVSTFSGGVQTEAGLDQGEVVMTPHPPQTTAEWDAFYRRLLMEFGADGNEYYGANPDGVGNEYDPVRNMWVRLRDNSDQGIREGEGNQAPSDTLVSQTAMDEPLTYGPRGIVRIYSRETILTSDSMSALGKEISGLTGFFQSAGINDLVYSDEFEVSEGALVNGPGYVIAGVTRYAVDETEGFSATYAAGANPSDGVSPEGSQPGNTGQAGNEARNRALNMLFGGDHDRVNWHIRNSTGYTGDYIRSLLFGGDNFLEDAGAYTPIDFYQDGSWFWPNELVLTGKMFVGHESPYELRIP